MKSSNSFQAVYYNEQKVVEQKAELLAAVNFEGSLTAVDFLSKNDYIRYFNEVSNRNSRVSRKQFHAVISTKGKAHTPKELKTIAEEYLKRMGYSDNPYLLYFHQDTENNHVHIVSTRVNTEGVKINDSFEKKESLRHIQNIMQQIPHRELDGKNIVDDVMSYQFSTEAQLKLLIERRGYGVQIDENRDLKITRDKRTLAKIDRKDISEKLKNYRNSFDIGRIKELKTVLEQYKKDKSKEKLQAYLKETMGIDLVFHQNQHQEFPHSYTIIDHSTQNVFKGSSIMSVSEILNHPEDSRREATNPHIENLKVHQNNKESFNDYLANNDLFVMEKGEKVFLFDRPNNEVLDVSEHRFFKEYSFMNLEDGQKEGLNIDLNINSSQSTESENDRKKKHKASKNIGYSY